MLTDTREILLEAARLGEVHGVAKGTFHQASLFPSILTAWPNNKPGSMCINGLIGAAILGHPVRGYAEYGSLVESNETFREVIDVIYPVVKGGGIAPSHDKWKSLAAWNNDEATEKQVIKALKKAAAELVPVSA